MRHQALHAPQIRDLTKSAGAVENRTNRIVALIVTLESVVQGRFNHGKKMPDGMIEKLFDACDATIGRLFKPIMSSRQSKPATRVRPKGEQLEACYVAITDPIDKVEGFDDLYQLLSLRLYATRKFMRMDVIAHPAVFQYHAAERLMERADGITDAIEKIGIDLTNWLPFLQHAAPALGEAADGHCNVPIGDNSGMLLGEFADGIPTGAIRIEFTKNGMTKKPMPGYHERTAYVARTFVDRYQLRPAQAYSMKLLTEWREEHGTDCHLAIEDYVWPWSFDTDNDDKDGFREEPMEHLASILRDPVFVRSMRPERNPRAEMSDHQLELGVWDPGHEDIDGAISPTATAP